MKFEIKKKVIKPLCIYSLAFSMLLPSVASLADLDINLGGYSVVYAAEIPAPTVTKAFIGTNTISGGNVHVDRVNKKVIRGTVHVILKDKDGVVKADNLTFTPKSGKNWTVNLPDGVTIAEGDTVTAYQEFNGQNSPATTANAEKGKNLINEDKLKMPSGEIWIEQTNSNIVNDDEKAEARDLFDAVNKEIAGDIKSVVFSIDGTDHAYYEVTYTDESTSGKIEAPNLKIKQVTEHSRGATLGSITIVDNVIKGQLAGEGPFDGIKVQILLKLSDAVKGSYCDGGECLTDKDTSDPVDATVDGTTGEFSYTIPNPDLKLDQAVGVTVKEPHKFKSCSRTPVIAPIPEKTEVKDPRKLTGEDKGKIIEAIKKAYTVGDVSKLPNGTGDWKGVPAVIQIDDSGNVKIFSGNDVAGAWDWNNGGIFVPEKNEDGSVKLTEGAQPKITIPGKDLLKNIKPDAPTVALSVDKKNITITPNLEVDTDVHIITVSYKDKDGKDQKTTATKSDNGTWSIAGEGTVVDGVITLPKDKVKGGTDVTATVTDKGGVADDDKTPLTSEQGSLTVEETKADKVEALGGLDPVVMKKWVGDSLEWKDGVKAKDSATEENKGKINELLKGAKFEDVTEEKRSTSNEGDFEGKIKITFDDKSELVVEKQVLYVSNHVTSVKRKDKVPTDALDVQFKLGEGVKVEDKDPNSGAVTKTTKGDKDSPVIYKEYKVKPGTNFSTYKHPTLQKTIFDLIDEKADEGYTEAVWKDSNGGTNFVAALNNNVFTATATKTFKVTVKPNGGTGDEKVEIKKKDETFKLPAANTFTPPNENQEFSGWKVGGDTNLKQPETEITITDNTEINAIWKPIEFKAIFQTEAGASGEMKEQTVTKGSEFKLPEPTFKPDKGKAFAGWKVGNEEGVKKAGDTIKIADNVTLTATWIDNQVDITFDKGEGSGDMTKETVKKGSQYKLPDSKFTPPTNQGFIGWKVGDDEEVKTVGTEITVNDNTKLTAVYSPIAKIKAPIVSVDTNTGNLIITPPTPPEGQKIKSVTVNYENNNGVGKEIVAEKSADGWNLVPAATNGESVDNNTGVITIPKGNYKLGKPVKAYANNQVNQKSEVADATPVEVSFDMNGGKKGVDSLIKIKDQYYVLPAIHELQEYQLIIPDGKEFDGWEIDGVKKAPGQKIQITDNTKVKALWRDKGTSPSLPEAPSPEEYEIPGIKIRDHYTPTFPVYVTVPKTEKVEKAEEVPVSLETHKAYIAGYEDNTLRAEGNLTRAEAAAMVTRLAGLGLSDNSMPAFKDMQKNAWYFRYINAAVKAKMLDADNGIMRPNDKITRAEFAKMLAAIDKENSSVSKFDDIKGHRYEKEINKIYGNNRIEGYEDGSFRPDAYLTRAESAAFLNRMFNRIADKEAYAGLEDKLAKFKDFDASKWYYDEMVEATNSHELTRRGKASDKFGRVYEKWTRILPSDVK